MTDNSRNKLKRSEMLCTEIEQGQVGYLECAADVRENTTILILGACIFTVLYKKTRTHALPNHMRGTQNVLVGNVSK